ncbi:MAG: hypothetical protein ACK40G_16025 [Cytophagaceae bacterium]
MNRHYLLKGLLCLLAIFINSCASKTEHSSPELSGFKYEEDFAVAEVMADSTASPVSFSYSASGVKKEPKPSTWKRQQIPANTAKLFVGDKEELPIKGSQIAVKIDGFRARVVIDAYFLNNRERQMEGTFKLQLPSDASPFYLAFGESVVLDKEKERAAIPFVNYSGELKLEPENILAQRYKDSSKVKEARMVAKEKAAIAYTETVRANVDPAIMEWAGADIFNCSVFPLMPGMLHRITFGYDVNLTETPEGRIFSLPVPNQGASLQINIDASAKNIVPEILPKNLISERKSDRMMLKAIDPYADEITVSYSGNAPVVLSQKSKEDTYFAASITAHLPEIKQNLSTESAILLIDVSLSSNPDKFNVWVKMADAILKNNQDVIKNFKVLFFNIEQFWWKENFTENNEANRKALAEYLNKLALEGATDLGSALQSASLEEKTHNNLFLLSDASITWGNSDPFHLAGKIKSTDRLFAFKSGMEGTDIKLLERLSGKTGGAVYAVVNEDQISKASTAFKNQSWKVTGIQAKGCEDLIIAGNPEYVYPSQKLIVTGRGIPEGRIVIQLSNGKEKFNIETETTNKISSDLCKRVYGQVTTSLLEDFGYLTEKYSKSYATHFRVTGKTCSLLMLESKEDYARFNINDNADAYVVKSKPATSIINETLLSMGEILKSSKATFVNKLRNLEKMAGVKYGMPAALELAIEKLPEEAFDVPVKKLSCKIKTREQIRTSTLENLNQQELDYDVINKEALYRKENYSPADGLKTLSSLVEKRPGDAVLLRDIGFTAIEWGMESHAYHLFRRVADARPFEPHTYHAIAQILASMGKTDLAVLYYELAYGGGWNSRYGEFNRIVGMDYLQLLLDIEKNKKPLVLKEFCHFRQKELKDAYKKLDNQFVVTIMWNTDNSDVDLHVIEPSGEECFYSNAITKSGGSISRDITTGYGPEMYTTSKLKSGDYMVKVKYFNSNRNRATARTKVYATIYKNFGRDNAEIIRKTVSLEDSKEMHYIYTYSNKLF